MTKPITIGLIGIGGYGNANVAPLLDAPDQSGFKIVGAVDPSPTSCRRLADLQSRNVPIYHGWQEFYGVTSADLMIVSTPIHLHARHTSQCLEHGSHVMCEKPLCVTPDEVRVMQLARDRASRQVAIGYQWSFSKAVQALKADVLAGKLGKPKRFKSLVLWPRDEQYYHRNRWAGLLRDPRGNWVLDSPVNNACAHHLHNMFYVIGPATDRSGTPVRVTAELYRAHPIENYDTAALRCAAKVDGDEVELLFIVSHATNESTGPVFSYEFERATASLGSAPDSAIVATFQDGTTKNYGSPNEGRDGKLWQTIDAVRTGGKTVCGIEAAASHSRCMWAAQQSPPKIENFPNDLVITRGEEGTHQTFVQGLGEALQKCYADWTLPTEAKLPWAKPAREVDVEQACDRNPL